jgi:hypothetical protein
MAKMTVLEMVQDILNDIDGDEVNSIDDTIESTQVSVIIKNTYDAMMSSRNWPHTKTLLKTIASADVSIPTHMTFNENVKELLTINYNKADVGETRLKYLPVKYLNTDDFLRLSNGRDNDDASVDIVVDPSSTVQLLIKNDAHPSYYTSFDDENLIFDSYDSDVDSTLISSKVQAMGYIMPTLVLSDSAVPDLPAEAFMFLLEESKSKVALKLRQVQDVKAETESRKQNNWISMNSFNVNGGISYRSNGRGRSRTPKTRKESRQ